MAGRTYLKAALSISIFFVATGWAGEMADTIYLDTADGPYASNPDPADGAGIPGEPYPDPPEPTTHIFTMLVFNPGSTAVKHTAYFSEDYSKVYNRHQDANLGQPPFQPPLPYPGWDNIYFAGHPEIEPAIDALVRETTYYWCVDETDGNNVVWQGPVWSFYVQGYYATRPNPPNEAINIDPNVLLSWRPGYQVDVHYVYIGTSWQDVYNADVFSTGIYQGCTMDPNWPCSGLPTDTKIYWRIDEVHDPHFMGPEYKGDVWCFTTVPVGLGTIRMDLWWNIDCRYIPCLLNDRDYPDNPDETRMLTSFNSGTQVGENYGGQIHGWVHPAKSGDYRFWLCTDEEGELYLSSDERPSNMQLIAKESLWTNPLTWNNDESMSALIPLVSGRKYYIMARKTEGLGGDHCMVAWQGPDQPLEPVNDSADAIIPGSRLSPFVQKWACDPDPFDGQTDVALTVTLRWDPGDYGVEHDVYIGTDKALVESRDAEIYMGRVISDSYGPIDLKADAIYYWAIDEVNELGPAPYIWPGYVWSFTTEPRRIYVDIDAGGANDGTSWENAYNYLQDALADANSLEKPVEIWVAQGIYKPDHGKNQHLEDQYASFELQNRVTIKGGYGGIGEPNPNARDITAYKTILSGEISDDEDSCHVVTGSGTDRTAVLDGFTITEGEAYNVSNNNDLGGGMYSYAGSPTIRNCTFTNNWALNYGGGMCNDGNSCPLLINCVFVQNSATDGGGMDNEYSHPILINCIFAGNWVDEYNADSFSGGAIYNFYSNPTLINCTITANVAVDWGICGGIYNSSTSLPTLKNCILSENSDTNGKTESSQIFGDTPLINYCCVQGWTGYLGGVGNMDEDPCFAKPAHWEDPCGTPGYSYDDLWIQGDLHLKSQAGRWDANSESWVLDDVTSPCIDAGNPGCPVGDEPSPNGNRRNMGAYGGTAEASKSPANWRSIADMTNDWVVDSNDLRVYVDYWLESGDCIPGDFDRSQFVDFDDFAILGLHWSYPSSTEPGMTFHIDDCTMEAGQKWTVAAEPNEPRFSVWVEGRYIHFEDSMYANCCPDELGLDKEINGNEITLYEIGYGGLCDCMCYFPITATLGPFEDGTYTIEVYDNYGNSLGIVEVTIGQSSGPTIIYEIEDCNQDASGVFAAEPPDLTRFTVNVEGLYIHFEDMMVANCCTDKLGLEMTVEDDLITIHETEYTPGGCFCICEYPVTAILGPFEPGIYTLEVCEDWGGFIGNTTVVIEPPE